MVFCYEVSLGIADETDYPIQANPPLGGANVTSFWIFRVISVDPKLVLFTGALALEIQSRKSNGLNEIRTRSVTMQHVNTAIYRFNGTKYTFTNPHQ